jgi:hypothetical protein
MAMPAAVALPDTARLLVAGGDGRLALDPATGLNRYLCRSFPDPELLAFGSSTASVISEAGLAAADRLRERLSEALSRLPEDAAYAGEQARIRRELLALCGIPAGEDIEVLFAGSGTDLHRSAARMAGGDRAGHLRAIVVDAAETGSGVPAALRGRRYPAVVDGGEPADGVEIVHVPVRQADGRPRPARQVDACVTTLTDEAVSEGRAVLLILVDVSKTGLVAPSPACAMALSRRHGDALCVLVDACQFRLAPATLRAYLEQGFAVALTGSKFMAGPVFSGAMLVPRASGWRHAPTGRPNPGLLLRWEAALAGMRAFSALDGAEIAAFLRTFSAAVGERLRASPRFLPLAQPKPDREPLVAGGWDTEPSIIPFLVCHADGRPFDRDASRLLYRWLQMDMGEMPAFQGNASARALASLRCQFGQPVACGQHAGVPVAALRLSLSARSVTEALAGHADAVIHRAMRALDKAEMLATHFHRIPLASAVEIRHAG